MKKYGWIALFFFTVSCLAGHRIMNEEMFSEVEIGMSEKTLKEKAGKPYAIKKLSHGEKRFEYIERIYSNNILIKTRRYFFILKNGKVVSKKVKDDDEFKPILERNSYDLQTSF